MEPKKMLSWNAKASIVYALGVWTMLGSFFFLRYRGKHDLPPAIPEDEEEENPYKVVHRTAHTKTTIIYKQDFVPYRIRFMNFIDSFTGGDSSRGSNGSK